VLNGANDLELPITTIIHTIFTVQRYASVVHAVIVCLSVCLSVTLSQVNVLL